LGLDGKRLERPPFQHRLDVGCLFRALDIELLELLAFERGQPRLEVLQPRCGEQGRDLPVILAYETLDLGLAVADKTQSNRLDAPGRARTRQLAPQDGRQR